MSDRLRHSGLGSAERFTRLWVLAQPVVSAYVFSCIRSRSDAEDVLQDVATAALEKFDRFDPDRPGSSFTGWALGIARNTVLNHHRTHRRDRHVFSDEAMGVLAAAHERAAGEIGVRGELLSHCLDKLPPRQAEILTLRYRDDARVADIAERLGTSANAVAIALHRTRQALAECIETRMRSGVADV